MESNIERKVTRYAKAQGWLAYKFTSPGNRGVPDHLYFKDGQTIAIEYKQPGGKPTPLQRQQIKRIQAAGIPVYVIDNIAAGCLVFDLRG